MSAPPVGAPRLAASSLGAEAQNRSLTHEMQSVDADAGWCWPSAGSDDDGRQTCVRASSASPVPAGSQKPPLLVSPSGDGGVPGHHGLAITTVSPEEAALAAGALAELRASVAVVAGRLATLEKGITGDTQTRQDLENTLAQQRCKQAEMSKQVSDVNESYERSSARLEEMTSDWCARYAQLESHLASLGRMCQDSRTASSTSVSNVESLTSNCNSMSAKLTDFLADWHSKHRQVDSRMLCLEQSCRDLQARAIDTAEQTRLAAQSLPAQEELERQLEDLHLRLNEQARRIDATERAKAAAQSLSVHADFERQLVELQLRLNEQDNCTRASTEASHQLRLSHTQLCSTTDAALVKSDQGSVEVRERLLALETFRSNLEHPSWQHPVFASTASAQTTSMGTAITIGWEVEARLRDIAEEVYSVSEHAMTKYVKAVHAELSERMEEILQQCPDKASVLPPPQERSDNCSEAQSLSCSDAFLEEVTALAFETVCNGGDTVKTIRASAYTPEQLAHLTQAMTSPCADTASPMVKQDKVTAAQMSLGRARMQTMSSDGGTGSSPLRNRLQLAEPLPPDWPAQTLAPPTSAPAGRPVGLARRLRSPSPGPALKLT